MTGIAAAHGVEGITVTTLWASYGFLVALSASALISGLVLFTEKSWPKRSSKTEIPSKAITDEDPKDAIGIWDSQRR